MRRALKQLSEHPASVAKREIQRLLREIKIKEQPARRRTKNLNRWYAKLRAKNNLRREHLKDKIHHLLVNSYGIKVKTGRIIICSVCSKEFYRCKSTIKRADTKDMACSDKCARSKRRNQVLLNCAKCDKEYTKRVSSVRWGKIKNENYKNFCSIICKNKYMRGGKIRSWKGGVALKKNLWIIFSKFIRLRDNGTCFSCGKKDDWRNMDAGHYIPKTAGLSLYFDEKNVNCQCTACNRFRHGNLSQYALELRRKYGETILEELEWKRRQITKISTPEYQKLIDLYKQKVKELLNQELKK